MAEHKWLGVQLPCDISRSVFLFFFPSSLKHEGVFFARNRGVFLTGPRIDVGAVDGEVRRVALSAEEARHVAPQHVDGAAHAQAPLAAGLGLLKRRATSLGPPRNSGPLSLAGLE